MKLPVFIKMMGQCTMVNWKWIAGSIILGLCIAFWVIPSILLFSIIKNFLTLNFSITLVLIAAISYFILILLYQPGLILWSRYKNNFTLKEVPFTYIDGFLIALASVIASAIIFPNQIFKDISISIPITIWMITFTSLLILILVLMIYKEADLKSENPPLLQEQSFEDFFPDEPITDEREDLLGRKEFVDSLYSQIINYPSNDSFVFGLNGRWGEGKTSVLNLLRNKLKQNHNVLIYEFDPWFFSSSEALVKRFYDGLYAFLNTVYFLPNTKKIFTKYQKLLSSAASLSGFSLDLKVSESIDDLKKNIERFIFGTGKKLIIIIDDVDRIQLKEEILELFKIVKLSGKFKNTIFVVILDRPQIRSFLKDIVQVDPLFLEKIIQNEINLPAVDQSMIDRFLFYSFPKEGYLSAMDRLFKKLEINPERVRELDKDFVPIYESYMRRLFTTLREAKKYLNGLYATLPAVKNEVNLQDFLILEAIRTFFPEIYRDIWENPWFYLPSSWSEKSYLFWPLGMGKEDKEILKERKDHVSRIVSENDDLTLELLKAIFFEVKRAFEGNIFGGAGEPNKARAEKRITHPEVFPKYFMLKIPPSEISDDMLEGLISQWKETDPIDLQKGILYDFENFRKAGKFQELLIKLRVFLPRIDQNVAKTLIKTISAQAQYLSKEDRENFWRSEFDRAEALLIQLIDRGIKAEEIGPLLTEVIESTPSFFLATSLVLLCREQRGQFFNIYKNVNLSRIQSTISKRLQEYFIEGKRDIFKEEKEDYGFILYQWGKNGDEERRRVNDYLHSLFSANPKYLGKFLGRYVIKWGGPLETQFNYDDLIKVYYEAELYKRIKDTYSEAYSTPEEQAALDFFIKIFHEKHKEK